MPDNSQLAPQHANLFASSENHERIRLPWGLYSMICCMTHSRPDVILLDLQLAEGDITERIPELVKKFLKTKIQSSPKHSDHEEISL